MSTTTIPVEADQAVPDGADEVRHITYTHIVHCPDMHVSHNFSMSGWNLKPRHAATYQPRKHKNFATLCGKELNIDEDYWYPIGNEARRSEGLQDDARCITCARCRKALGLMPLPSRRRRQT